VRAASSAVSGLVSGAGLGERSAAAAVASWVLECQRAGDWPGPGVAQCLDGESFRRRRSSYRTYTRTKAAGAMIGMSRNVLSASRSASPDTVASA
jgi:hypothetical protein